MALLAGALALAPSTALAQEVPPASNTQAPESVGPKELQNFNLSGTVTREADRPATTTQPATQNRPPRAQAQPAPSSTQPAATTEQANSRTAPSAPPPARRPVQTAANSAPPAAEPDRAPEPLRQSTAPSSVTVALPKLDLGTVKASVAAPAPAPGFAPDPEPAGTLAPERKLSILPWLLAALALGAGGAFLFWRNRSRHAFAGGPQIDAYAAPEPAPQPRPSPAPKPAAKAPEPQSPAIPGIVSTRLRPWIDIGFKPLRCVLDKEKVTVDFELELFNSGSAPARAVLVEGTLFNAGPNQDREIAAFFANPIGEGERIVAIPPLQRVAVRTQVSAPCSQLQAYELGGHEVFVPLIAFNALYRWGSGEGQTSASYLLGRDTKGEKMGPFRLDLGPRIFRAVAARLLPAAIRQ
jgi:hypothetical protein